MFESVEADRPKVDNYLSKNQSKKRFDDLLLEKRAVREEMEAKMEEARRYADNKPLSPRKSSVPRHNETSKLAPRSDADFVSRNKVKAQAMAGPRRQEDDDEGPIVHNSFGRVPTYLENRKARWAEEQEAIRRNAPDPSCPRGMMLMPEEERLHTLDTLHSSKEEAMRQLSKMPFVIETPTQKKKQDELEAKLREIERAIALFSKPKVYIAADR